MDELIRVSVIIPLYNKAAYIQKAIESVLGQTFADYELIIVDDGSTDNSLDLVRNIADSRLVIVHQPNQGVSSARNNGVRAARYDYVAFLDADDWWHPMFLEKMLDLIRRCPGAGIYGCQYFWVKNGKHKTSVNHEPPGFIGYFDYFAGYTRAWWMPLTSISVVIRKAVFNEMGGFKTKLKFGEDFDLWVSIALKHKVAYLNKPLAYYNQDVVATNRALGGKRWEKEEHFIFNLGYLADAERRNPKLKTLLDGLRVRSLARFYLRNDHPQEVREILATVNLSQQPRYFQWLYSWPRPLVKMYFQGKRMGSVVKQTLLKI